MPRSPRFTPTVAPQTASAAPNLFVGTSGWAYPSWKPGFYPKDVPARAFLHTYAARLNAVEVNYTFRTLPGVAQLQGWLEATPPGFRFSFKAPQRITHFSRLRNCSTSLEAFFQVLQPVHEQGRLGTLLFQLPPNLKVDVGLLRAFLQEPLMQAARHLRFSFEFRHESWFHDATWSALHDADAALCVADTDDLQTPDVVTAPFRTYRLRQDGGYSSTTLKRITRTLVEATGSGEVYAFFRHQEEPTGALNAEGVLHLSAETSAGKPRSRKDG